MSKAKPPPQWKSSELSSGLAHLGWPALSKEDGERVTKLVRPKPSQRDDCLREAAISVQWIKRKTAATRTPRQRKKALINAAKKIAAAIKSIEGLPEDIENAVDRDITVRPPQPNIQYFSFVDGNGGRNDSFCAAVAHLENNIAVLDCLMEIRAGPGVKYDPDTAVPRIADMLKQYRCYTTTGDHYGAEWIIGSFKRNGITYRNTDRNKSKIYCDALPLFTTGRARILDVKRLVNQLCSLERKTTASGDKVDHGPGGHDDCANVVCGALVLATADKLDTVPIMAPIVCYGPAYGSQWDNRG